MRNLSTSSWLVIAVPLGSEYLLYNYNMVSVRLSVRRRFRVLIDVVEPARTVGFGKPDSENGSRDLEKRAARQGRAGQGAGPCGKGRGQIKSKR